ncbi:MAG: cell division protein FtsZ [Myxococcota bacterium]|jgi:cell division protein FtsZ|nr:cell division protein FtsZ [Myxococcota bacterium]
MSIDWREADNSTPCVKVCGVGGGGSNAIDWMIAGGRLPEVDFIAVNTDLAALQASRAPQKVQIGIQTARGHGAGADPQIGRASAIEDHARLSDVLYGADMVFVTCGMGGGTGTGAAPVVAQAARELGALTVGVVTRPFFFEGNRRAAQATAGIEELRKVVDTLIIIPNDRLFDVVKKGTELVDSFLRVNQVLENAVAGIAEVIRPGGLVRVDFADVRTIMQDKGTALMGTGRARGEGRARAAADEAIHCPLLEDLRVDGAKALLINVTASSSLTIHEIRDAVAPIEQCVDPDAHVIFGAVVDDAMGDELKVTVIATGIQEESMAIAPAIALFNRSRDPRLRGKQLGRPLDTERLKEPAWKRNATPPLVAASPSPRTLSPAASARSGGLTEVRTMTPGPFATSAIPAAQAAPLVSTAADELDAEAAARSATPPDRYTPARRGSASAVAELPSFFRRQSK